VPQPNLSAYERGRRAPSPEVVSRLEEALRPAVGELLARHRDRIRELLVVHHAYNPRVFGSVARGQDGQRSDLDVVVDFTEEASLLDEVGLRLALQDLLQIEVDVVGADSIRGPMLERVVREAVPLDA